MDWNKKLACLLLSAVAAAGHSARGQDYPPPLAPTALPPLASDAMPWPSGAVPPSSPPTPVPGRPVGGTGVSPVSPPARPVNYQESIPPLYTASPPTYATTPAYASAPPAAETTITQACFAPFTESTWYTRIDYFHWNEQIDGFDLVNEDGALTTLGYERRVGRERFRAELFGGSVHYDGFAMFDDGSLEPLSSHTNYLGVRGEYELLFEPEWLPRSNFFTGLGTRFWIRDLPDDFTDAGDPVFGYQETWWTIYPYVGLDKKRILRNNVEFYWSSRIGLTAVTYQHATIGDRPLWPKLGVMTRAELGVRGPRWFLLGAFETMSWGESDVVQGWLQPASTMSTIGLETGFTF